MKTHMKQQIALGLQRKLRVSTRLFFKLTKGGDLVSFALRLIDASAIFARLK